ncbi:cell division protein FtsX [Nonomuraea angiospora]|uniref:cell division protein FtsX n=1 Tax=Nonomuraea angiospora TaxID=46172 RepID=UPI0029A0B106|nr:permease-like cell division protein FtsX [Nonomuraea angiospora]MDX3102115.1 permease-like cell division protein FtsX [Nonomuraea angiospora]
MNSSVETRLRDALAAVGDTVDRASVRPLMPPRRRRFRVRARFAVIGAGLAMAGAAGAVTLAPAGRQPVVLAAGVSPFMAGDWTEGKPEIAVFLCKAGSESPSCGAVVESREGAVASEIIAEGKGITAAQQADLERVLRARPELASVTFEDRRAAYTKFRQELQQRGDTKLAAALSVNDMPSSFRLKMKPDADWSAVAEAVKGMPGVDAVINQKCVDERDGSVPTECVVR